MLRLVKLFLLLSVACVATVVLIGFVADTAVDSGSEITIDAPPERVFAIIVDRDLRPSWFARALGGPIERVESMTGTTADPAASPDAPTHRYHMAGGITVDARMDEVRPGSLYAERVVRGEGGLGQLFDQLAWRFVLQPVEGDPSRTRLAVTTTGTTRRPVGAFLNAFMRAFDGYAHEARAMALAIERIHLERTRDGKRTTRPGPDPPDEQPPEPTGEHGDG
jgi:hypothetical protein